MFSEDIDVIDERLDDDLWLLSRNGMHIAFSPLACIAFEVKEKGIEAIKSHFKIDTNPQLQEMLIRYGYFTKREINRTNSEVPFSPEGVVLSLTSGCNLRCIYCYANAGSSIITMNEGVGKIAIDFVMENAIRLHKNKSRVFFHGGGEAMFVWPLLTKLTEYTMSKWGKFARFSTVTNGTLISPSRANWLAKHKFRLTISLDGPKPVQDYQRPMAGGKSSFEYCYRSLKLLKERGLEFGIRATVTHESAPHIEELVRIASEFGCGVKLEPFTAVGRGIENFELLGVDPLLFAKTYLRAEVLAQELGIPITTTYQKIEIPGENFCAGNGSMFLVTPTGDISSCSRATQQGQDLSEEFFIGKIIQNEVKIFPDKVKQLRRLSPSNFPECKTCYAKYYCRGGCHNSRLNNGGNPESSQCKLSRWFIWLNLFRKVANVKQDGNLY